MQSRGDMRTPTSKAALFLTALTTVLIGWSSDALAGRYIIHLHGRSSGGWSPETVNVGTIPGGGWQNVTLCYNGSARLNSAETNAIVKNEIRNKCSSANMCVLHCYSAGCARMLKAVSDLRAEGADLGGLQWAVASGSAAGGTGLAELSTTGLTGFLAKLLGVQEPIDHDITPGAARNTWGYIQHDMPKLTYHIAGRKDTCVNLLVARLCGNAHIGGGMGDGLVPLASAGGFSSAAAVTEGCPGGDPAAGKYTNRRYAKDWDTDEAGVAGICDGLDRDHAGIVGWGTRVVAGMLAATSWTDQARIWSDYNLLSNECSGSQCDERFVNGWRDFAMTRDGVWISTSTAARGSDTAEHVTSAADSCFGHCGRQTPSGKWCDAWCENGGSNCGADYAAAGCGNFNTANVPIYRGRKTGSHVFTFRREELAGASLDGESSFSVRFYLYPLEHRDSKSLWECKDGAGVRQYRLGILDLNPCPSGTTGEALGHVGTTRWKPTDVDLYLLVKGTDSIATTSTTEYQSLYNSGWTLQSYGYVSPATLTEWCPQ
jgi:hypothetical protein